jgi:hypothetical protein
MVSTWQAFATDAPELASRVHTLFSTHRHHTMATLRSDGSPRLSGTEIQFEQGEVVIGMMPGTRRAADLRRDPRLAIHSHSLDPPEDDHRSWPGEAKLDGRAVELLGADNDADRFRIDIGGVVLTRIGTPADHLVIEIWSPGEGVVIRRR